MNGDDEREERVRRAYEEWKQGKASMRGLADRYGIPRATLQRRFKKIEEEVAESGEIEPRLDAEEPTEDSISQVRDEEAAQVFELLEAGETLPKIVIKLKMNPKRIEELYQAWIELKEIDVNQPTVLKQVREIRGKLSDHLISLDHTSLGRLLHHARDIGMSKKDSCKNVDEYGCCTLWFWSRTDGSKYYKKADPLRCTFCDGFEELDA